MCIHHVSLVSFVGHSLGGLVIRSALTNPLLSRFENNLYLYMTLATPHLGTVHFQTKLLPSGKYHCLVLLIF